MACTQDADRGIGGQLSKGGLQTGNLASILRNVTNSTGTSRDSLAQPKLYKKEKSIQHCNNKTSGKENI